MQQLFDLNRKFSIFQWESLKSNNDSVLLKITDLSLSDHFASNVSEIFNMEKTSSFHLVLMLSVRNTQRNLLSEALVLLIQ